MYLHSVLSCFGLLRGEASRCSTNTVRIKSAGFAKDIIYLLEADVCLEKAPSCIHIVFYHGLGLLRCDAPGGFTGSARIKHDGFAKDTLSIAWN